ncbi:MAG: hypothetical protein HY593_04025 [Candidatus Omnitrophica bacterium]|nr:hypothetical protein [Candidatus Omnitrophota bacterium]
MNLDLQGRPCCSFRYQGDGFKSPLPPLKRKGGKGFLFTKQKKPKATPFSFQRGQGGFIAGHWA